MCHVVHDEYRGRVSCAMFYTTNIMMVVCYAVDAECSGVSHVNLYTTSTVVMCT